MRPVVFVLDTGVTLTPDLDGAVSERLAWDGGPVDDTDHEPTDPYSGHGTFDASTIVGAVNGWGSAGLFPYARVISYRAFDRSDGPILAGQYLRGIVECSKSQHAVRVINLSLGRVEPEDPYLPELRDFVRRARLVDSINVVAAAGNRGASDVDYPARLA